MADQRITLTCDDDGIAHLRMEDRVGLNALSLAFVEELGDRIRELGEQPGAKVCLLSGLEDVFCAGGDKDMLLGLARGEVSTTDIMLSRAVLEIPIPVLAVMEGHAVGGGLTLALCCDVLLMARESRYGCSFMNMGFTPGMGTTRLLELAVGPYLAAEMMFGGQFFRGSHFEGRGGINYVLPKKDLAAKAEQVAKRFAEKPRYSLELLKRSLSIPKRQIFEEARTSESFMHELSFARPETQALIQERYEER